MNMFQRCGFSRNEGNGLCIKSQTIKYSILINGTPTGFFRSSRGICQRDPPSPLLFDIVIEALSHMLDVVATIGQFLSLSIGTFASTLTMVSHLLFVDD